MHFSDIKNYEESCTFFKTVSSIVENHFYFIFYTCSYNVVYFSICCDLILTILFSKCNNSLSSQLPQYSAIDSSRGNFFVCLFISLNNFCPSLPSSQAFQSWTCFAFPQFLKAFSIWNRNAGSKMAADRVRCRVSFGSDARVNIVRQEL